MDLEAGPLKPAPRQFSAGAPALTAAGLVLLGAFFLRVYRLDGQSFWSDEGATAFMTARGPADILAVSAADIHPPLYYLLTAAWARLAGTTEFALRFPSVLAGVVVVALVFWLGRRCLGFLPAIGGSFFAAGSALLIYYSQEARMYELLALFGLTTTVLAVVLLGLGRCRAGLSSPLERLVGQARPRTRRDVWLAVAYCLSLAALLYTQYLGVLAAVVANLYFVGAYWRITRWWRVWIGWAALQGIAGLLFLPWAIRVFGQVGGWPAISESLQVGSYSRDVLRVFAYGLSWDATVTLPAEVLIVGLLGFGLLWPWVAAGDRRRNGAGLAIVLTLALGPVIGLFLLSLRQPAYNPKFLITAVPGFALWLGLGLATAAELVRVLTVRWSYRPALRVGRVVLVALVVAGLCGVYAYFDARSLRAYYTEAKYQRDDYRGLANRIAVAAQPGDAIVLNAPGQVEIFGYYDTSGLPVYPLPAGRPPDRAATEAALEAIARDHQRIWLVLWATQQSDPESIIENWLDRHAFKARGDWYGTVRLVQYTLPEVGSATAVQPADVSFENGIRLTGYGLAGSGNAAPAESGGVLNLQLAWESAASIDQRYVVFAHLIDEQENIWGQRDSEPAGGARPTSEWQPGVAVEDNRGLPILPGTPPGEYRLEVGLYLPQTGERLRTADGATRAILGPFRIGPAASVNAVPDPSGGPLEVDAGPLTLLGVEFHALGQAETARQIGRGQSVRLATWWRAGPNARELSEAPRLTVSLVGSSGETAHKLERPLTDDRFPPSEWRDGELILDQTRFPVDLPPGRYELRLSLTTERGTIPVGGGRSFGTIEVAS